MITQTAARIVARTSRTSWTDEVWKSHYTQQVYRFVRLFVVAFGMQLVLWSPHGVDDHMTWKVIGALAVAAFEAVWREFFPTTPPAPADPPADDVVTPAEPVVEPEPVAVRTPRKTAAKKTAARRTPRR